MAFILPPFVLYFNDHPSLRFGILKLFAHSALHKHIHFLNAMDFVSIRFQMDFIQSHTSMLHLTVGCRRIIFQNVCGLLKKLKCLPMVRNAGNSPPTDCVFDSIWILNKISSIFQRISFSLLPGALNVDLCIPVCSDPRRLFHFDTVVNNMTLNLIIFNSPLFFSFLINSFKKEIDCVGPVSCGDRGVLFIATA